MSNTSALLSDMSNGHLTCLVFLQFSEKTLHCFEEKRDTTALTVSLCNYLCYSHWRLQLMNILLSYAVFY